MMKVKNQPVFPRTFVLTLLLLTQGQSATLTVDNAGSDATVAGTLPWAIANAQSGDVVGIQSGLGDIQLTSQLFINASITIVGNGNTIDMQSLNRAFFIAGGTISISDLTILNGLALGGAGADGGGGGMGVGGAIFVANGVDIANSGVTLATNVTLSNVQFGSNSAVGGKGGDYTTSGAGGGGGMGGKGGEGYSGGFTGITEGGGGGGGFGNGADGGASDPDSPGAGSAGSFPTATTGGGTGGSDHGGNPGAAGGIMGGGGGGSNSTDAGTTSGGGGGISLSDGSSNGGHDVHGGAGGWGGGGGGSSTSTLTTGVGGNGGFGGGGGGGIDDWGGNGGFGGGAGGGGFVAGTPGFGAGAAGSSDEASPYGGGGLGAGGAIFVMKGASLTIADSTFTDNTVTGGAGNSTISDPSSAGFAVGSDLFLGADTTFQVANTMTVNLGGSGNSVDAPFGADPTSDAAGGVIKTGAGTLQLTGQNYYSGTTTIQEGTLKILQGSSENGTSGIVVGQIANTTATLQIANDSQLILQGFDVASPSDSTGNSAIVLGAVAGSTGTLQIGDLTEEPGGVVGNLGAQSITSGSGTGVISFRQNYDDDTLSYTIYSTLSGDNLSVRQEGEGTTILQPTFGSNTYGGGTFITNGTLELGATNALPVNGTVTVEDNAVLQVGSFSASVGDVTQKSGGILGGTLSATSVTSEQGVISTVLAGTGSFTKTGTGSTILTGVNTYSGGTLLLAGTLVTGMTNALPTAGAVTVQDGTLNLAGLDGTVGDVLLQNGSIIGTDSETGSSSTLTTSAVTTENGTISVILAGSGGLTKNGGGTTYLTAANTFTGTTTINAGTLHQSRAGATSGYTVGGGAENATLILEFENASITPTLLAANGTLVASSNNTWSDLTIQGGSAEFSGQQNGSVTLDGGSILMQEGKLNLTSLALTSDSMIQMALDPTNFVFTEGLGGSLDAVLHFQVTAGENVTASTSYLLLFAESLENEFTRSNFSITIDNPDVTGFLSWEAGALTWTVLSIPEPSVTCLLVLTMLAFIVSLRRMRKKSHGATVGIQR